MSKFFNNPTIGIDVSADFSMVAILKCYQTPQSILNAPKEDILKILRESSKKNLT